ncbi:uncharacterized protein LOC107273981 [Cephus cinctus]|uniref:Uncharacterized protein LOC107273981 n=1 Tax=Cephus cinctus TaxID=211228 RepID=A0AAJ7FTZ0_CEPCN|nr:uncharacterized protein LOC107273981 [Cephus cinctus]
MALTRLGVSTLRAVKESGSIYRYATQCVASQKFGTMKNENQEDDDENKPIKFSTSPAASWKAQDTFFINNDERPWYQPYVISASLSVFMIYFLVLREENDIDRLFDRDLYDHIEGLEEQHIREAQQYAIQLEAKQAS